MAYRDRSLTPHCPRSKADSDVQDIPKPPGRNQITTLTAEVTFYSVPQAAMCYVHKALQKCVLKDLHAISAVRTGRATCDF
mmetsp:Transcript_10490/g.17157  ORF Transcript_10490/g.17157 Transcript_10490/m.17157 type:complete len:81 (+) Transcript_10490:375-617(+)